MYRQTCSRWACDGRRVGVLIRDPDRDDNRQRPEVDLIEEWKRYMAALGFRPAARKIYTQTLSGLQLADILSPAE